MTDPNLGSGFPGSPNVPASAPGQAAPAGQTNNGGAIDYKKAYEEVMPRMGTMGNELGEYRQFFQNIAPLLDKLDQAPELVQAIVDGKLDKDIGKAVLEGRVDIRDAAAVQQAHEQVKAELGKKGYEKATADDITKLVEQQVGKFRKEFEEKQEYASFQEYTQKFIENTPDFQEYADDVDKWLDTHDVTDIEVAYYAVKGKLSETKAKKLAEVAGAERAKEYVANAQGGNNGSQYAADGTPLVDALIAGRPNPNSFFQ